MTFFLEKSTSRLQPAVQQLLQRLPLQSHPLSLVTEPSRNPNPTLLKRIQRHTQHKHEPPQKPRQLLVTRACQILGHLQIPLQHRFVRR